MDGAGFQGMPRFALTPAEEALVPRPHSSASQVATAVPCTYTRRSSSSAASSPLHSRHHHRSQYQRKHNDNSGNTNHPYSSQRHASSNNNISSRLGLSVSFSSHSLHSHYQQQQPPSPSSPLAPSSTGGLHSDADENEYPQNPQDHYHHPSVHFPLPVRPSSSQSPPPRRSFALSPRANRPVSPYTSDNNNTNNNNSPTRPSSSSHAFLDRGSLDSYPHKESTTHLSQSHQDSWESSVRVDSPEPMTDSDDSYNASKDIPRQPRQSTDQGFFGGRRGSAIVNSSNNNNRTEGSSRISLELELPSRNIQDSSEELSSRPTRTKPTGQHDISDEERQEPRRSRSGWRPSLSLIRQESSSFNVPVLHQPRVYLQNDQRRVGDMAPADDPHPETARRRRKKRKKGPSRRRQREGHDLTDKYAVPDLFQVLEKRTRYPLSYDDFEAFLRRQRAVEYLNFWTDVTAHEQLCRTFDVSERRCKRELQLEDRAIARDRRRQTRAAPLENGRSSPDPGTGRAGVLGEGQSTDAQGLNSSSLYITSRSSLQLPLNNHLSFPLETRRYGLQDSASPFPFVPPSLAQRRGSEQRPMGAYNRLLTGAGGRRTSMETSRYSLDESPILEQEGGGSSASMPSVPRSRTRGSIDAVGNSRLLGRRPSATEDHVHHHRQSERPAVSSPLNPTRPALPEHTVQAEMDQLAQAVEDSIQFSLGQSQTEITPMPQASVQSLRIVEPILERNSTVANFEGGHGPLLPPLAIRRSGESAYVPSHYSTVHDGRAMLAQSYRTISVEDLEESVARIYRKYLIQLRTMSMAAEEEAVAAAASKEANGNNPHETVVRNSLEKTFAPGWDGYAEQVISEWNDKWRRRDSNARRARRASARRGVSGRGDAAPRHGSNYDPTRAPGATAVAGDVVKLTGSSEIGSLDRDGQEDDSQDTERAPKSSKRPKLKRETTGTGVAAFLSRLLRTEMTVVELPTLTINMTTVEEDYDYDTDESDYEEDSEYDSDDEQEEDDEEVETSQRRTPMTKNILQLEIKPPEPLFMKDRNSEPASPSNVTDEHYTSTVNGSLAGDRAVSEADTHDSAIPLQSLFARPSIDTPRHPLTTLTLTDALTPFATASPQTPTPTVAQAKGMGTTSTATGITIPQLSNVGSSHVAASAVAAAFYLPLECRQRIHAQVHQEGRTDVPHLFGPAKNFVVDVVLREHYFPLFLEYVKAQNLGLLHESHINNRIKRQGLIYLGVSLWAVVVAVQLTLVMMAWGGWRSPWVWVVGIVGGYPGSLFLATGLTRFSPILGLVGKIAEDKRVVRFRKTMEPSIVKLHRKKALWMMFNIVVCSSAVAIAFAALPQRTQQ